MTNHVHFVVEAEGDAKTISHMMKRVNGRQTAHVNKVGGRSGTLWNDRYKASPIQRENYLLACIRYIELNPVRAGLVRSAEDYPWSSIRFRISGKTDTLLDLDFCYKSLGRDHSSRTEAYRKYLAQATDNDEIREIRSAISRNQPTGNLRFIDEIEQRIGVRIEKRGRGRPAKIGK